MTLLVAALAGARSHPQDITGAGELERAFAEAFVLAPEMAQTSAGAVCKRHGQQAAMFALERNAGKEKAAALARSIPPAHSDDAVGQRVDSAHLKAQTAVVAFVFGPAAPTPELADAMVNAACLLGAGQVIRQTGI